MNISTFCPISHKKINERVARINAFFTVLLLVVFGLTQHLLPVVFLGVDFLIRTSEYSRFSLIGMVSKWMVSIFDFDDVKINAGPKIFAARIGFMFTILIVLAFSLGFPVLAFSLTGILGLFSLLESAFGICVACEIYPFVYKFIYKDTTA